MPFGKKNLAENTKRSSYYVCFIGAKESPVVRDHNHGHEFVYPAMHYLLRSVMEAGPLSNAPRITLQISDKGLKILQNVNRQVLPTRNGGSQSKSDTLRHSIPHHCVTCAYQGEPPYNDLVATVLLIFNPATHCPVHIHVYRCDSEKTAALLTQQLVTMAERPENQARFAAIEGRLRGRGLLHPVMPMQYDYRNVHSQNGKVVLSDGQSSGRSSSSPDTSLTGKQRPILPSVTSSERVPKNLDFGSSSEKVPDVTVVPTNSVMQNADKLTAELKERLKSKASNPILLPPKDYDTVNRNHGKIDITVKPEEAAKRIVSEPVKHASKEELSEESYPQDDDDEWQVDEEEEDTFRDREGAVLTKADFGTHGFHERLKRYCSLNDVFGESKAEYSEVHRTNAKVSEKELPKEAKPASADASAAYRPRPYYFNTVDEQEKSERIPRHNRKEQGFRSEPVDFIEQDLREPREPNIIIQSQHVRPSLPLKRNQRPVVSERVRPASFYERIRFDEQDFQEGRFVRPEIVYYQYRC